MLGLNLSSVMKYLKCFVVKQLGGGGGGVTGSVLRERSKGFGVGD